MREPCPLPNHHIRGGTEEYVTKAAAYSLQCSLLPPRDTCTRVPGASCVRPRLGGGPVGLSGSRGPGWRTEPPRRRRSRSSHLR